MADILAAVGDVDEAVAGLDDGGKVVFEQP
jgi:hypothetical protein